MIPKSGESLQHRMEKPSFLQADVDDWQSFLTPLGAKYFVCFPCEKSKKNVCAVKGVVIWFARKLLKIK